MDLFCGARFWNAVFRISGCAWTLGWMPMPTARRMARAILRWLTGRRPVSEECLTRPMGVMNSEMMEKF